MDKQRINRLASEWFSGFVLWEGSIEELKDIFEKMEAMLEVIKK